MREYIVKAFLRKLAFFILHWRHFSAGNVTGGLASHS